MASKIKIGTLFGLIYLVGVIVAQNSPDIAYNKPVSQKSTFNDEPSRYGAMFAVNGQGCQTQGVPRFKTKDEYEPWWRVDLQGNYFIRNVTITPSPERSETMRYNIAHREIRDQRDVCNYEDDGTRGPVYPCNRFGKIILLKRWGSGILSFCNVQIYGDEVCENPKLYGGTCGIPCYTQCATNWCRKQDGRCDECNDGYYGDRCDIPCSTGCTSTACDKDDGRCDCKPRHNQIQGVQCLPCPTNCQNSCNQTLYCDHCKDGYYGKTCDKSCSSHCETAVCDRQDGICQCQVGYAGHPCQKCPVNCDATGCDDTLRCLGCKSGFYGQKCEEHCSPQCTTVDCGRSDGRCQKCPDTCDATGCDDTLRCYHCNPGFSGNHCNITCSVNCINETCNRNGSCECKLGFAGSGCCPKNCLDGCSDSFVCRGCKSNYHGHQCRNRCPVNCLRSCYQAGDQCIECQDGYWGPLCEDKCSSHCNMGRCSQDTGICTCKPGYQGTSCEKCNAGYYGEGCDQTCSDHCEESCNHVNGSCNCKPGYTGNMCHERCVTNAWGPDCNGTCHCASGSCHHVNGSCSSGCAEGWCGEACQMKVRSIIKTCSAVPILASFLVLSLLGNTLQASLFIWILKRVRSLREEPESATMDKASAYESVDEARITENNKIIYQNDAIEAEKESQRQEGEYEELKGITMSIKQQQKPYSTLTRV